MFFQEYDPTDDGVLVFGGESLVPRAKLIGVLDLPHVHQSN